MKKFTRLSLSTITLCLLSLIFLHGCAPLHNLVENKKEQNRIATELTKEFCQDCRKSYCLRIGEVTFSSDKEIHWEEECIFLEQGSELTIQASAICCEYPETARNVILQATLSPGLVANTDHLSDLRQGDWNNANISFTGVPLGTYALEIKLRALTMRGQDTKDFILKVY